MSLGRHFCWAIAQQGNVCWSVDSIMSQQHASVSQGRICSDSCTCCHTEIEDADQTFYFTQSQYTDTGTASPSTDPIMPDTWQASHGSTNFYVTGMRWPGKNPGTSGTQTPGMPLYNNNNNNNNNRIQRRYSRFFTISSQRRELSPTRMLKWPRRNRVQITCNTLNTYQVQVSCYVPLGTNGQLSYQVWQSWNRIYLSSILLAEP